jgi:hypothetical protein
MDEATVTDVDPDVTDVRLAVRREREKVTWPKERGVAIDGYTDRRLRLGRARDDHGEPRHHILNEPAAVEATLRGGTAVLVPGTDLRAGERHDGIT